MVLTEFGVDEIIFKNGSFPFTYSQCIAIVRATERIVEQKVEERFAEEGQEKIFTETRVREMEAAIRSAWITLENSLKEKDDTK